MPVLLAASDWPAWIALFFSGGAVAWQVVTHFWGRDDRKRRDDELRALRQAQTEALLRIADAAGGQSGESAHAQGAQLSAEIAKTGQHSYKLVVTNLGPGGAQFRSIDVRGDEIRQPHIDLTALDQPIDLLPGEQARFLMSITLGVALPIEIVLHWIDSRGEQQREMRLTL